ncbi:hypothetical protein GCM10025860_09090 [Methanobacterium ferruginis]|nr:hypothetical protein GCM10025860_09090 [Methanobacterium ferruginis]
MDPKYSDTAKMSDIWIGFEQNGDYGFYNAIRAALKGKKLIRTMFLAYLKKTSWN